MRVVKEASVRKNEILDAAYTLFAEKGFDNTSINEIQKKVGIARGTLYHHFKSKEEMMDAIIERQGEFLITAARQVAEDRTIPVKERLVRAVMALHMEETPEEEGEGLIEHLHKPQNALMHQKSKAVIIQQVPPLLAEILQDGIEQGIFDTPYPLECMEMAVAYLSTVFDDGVIELTEEQRITRVEAFIFHLERLLGTEKGELALVSQMFAEGEVE